MIKEKIQKLLALSTSPNEAEAASALAKARKLLALNGLRMADICSETPLVSEGFLDTQGPIEPWEEKLMLCIASATFVQIIKIYEHETERAVLVGREVNIVTAQILYKYLHDSIVEKSMHFTAPFICVESLRQGMVAGIKRKLDEYYKPAETVDTGRSLILHEAAERRNENLRYIREKYDNPESSDNWYGPDPNSFGLGKSIASKISVNKQLGWDRDRLH